MSHPPEGQQLPAPMKFLLKLRSSYRFLCHLYACTRTYLFFSPRGAPWVLNSPHCIPLPFHSWHPNLPHEAQIIPAYFHLQQRCFVACYSTCSWTKLEGHLLLPRFFSLCYNITEATSIDQSTPYVNSGKAPRTTQAHLYLRQDLFCSVVVA